jgi:hypothetical protein
MSLVLEAKVRHCASASDPIHLIVSFVVIVQTVPEDLWPTPRRIHRWVGQLLAEMDCRPWCM